MKSSRLFLSLFLAASAALGLVAAAGTAAAAESNSAVVSASATEDVTFRPLVNRATESGVGVAAREECEITAWGYTGVIYCDSAMLVDWYGDGSRMELFGIDRYRQIWHVWPGAGRWHVMPGNGRADDTYGASMDGSGNRYVSVAVWGSGLYCTADPAGPASWNGWHRC